MTHEKAVALWVIVFSGSLSTLYLMAYRNPGRNRVTRYIESYLSRTWGGFRVLTPRQSMLSIAVGGLVGVVMGVVFFFREGWWKF